MMLIMSLCALPLAVFDVLFVPAYWRPETLLQLPIGVEGFLFSFFVGGIASALYAELVRRTPQHVYAWHKAMQRGVLVPVTALITFGLLYAFGAPNPELAAYGALAVGVVVMFYVRHDLAIHVLWGSLAFGVVYYISLKIWTVLFPDVHSWFVFQNLPKLFIWGVPGWEVLFGFFFGAFWSVLYEAVFGYKLVRLAAAKVK